VVVGGQSRHVIGYMKDFLFGPEQANTPVGVLSGGERGRLMLARALAKPANLLVLDEPTNDLDLETLDLLQELLADYPGTVLLVSHDRDFLDRVVTSTIATEGDGRWVEYAGGYSDMLAQRAGAAEQRPDAGSPGARIARIRAQPPSNIARIRAQSDPAIAPNRARSGRLSFKERHALDTLPARIADLQSEITSLHAALADPDLYARDPAAFQARSEALGRAEQALAEAEEQWLTLEMLREEIEG
jgi:ABC transport system ATP-binding/permease protein